MNNQKNENEKIDLSRFPIGKKEPISDSKKSFSPKNIGDSFAKMDEKNKIYIIIIIISFILMVIFLSLFLSKKSEKGGTVAPEYAPPAEEENMFSQ
ncbi:hypothetical protein KAT95_01250 [Candidatus Parcubacteria bacterium]|nr:hypothetical protein [Candidatus Parcubacteria bacterium]